MNLGARLRLAARRAVRPFARPLLNRLDASEASIRLRLEALEARLEAYSQGATPDQRIADNLVRRWAALESRLKCLELAVRAEHPLPDSDQPSTVQSRAPNGNRGYRSILYPDLVLENWQMLEAERMALTGLLHRLRPRNVVEIGVYFGGSLRLLSSFADRVWAVDVDPAVLDRVSELPNVDLRIGHSLNLVPDILTDLTSQDIPLHFVLIDADHSPDGVRRDIDLVLSYRPREDMFIVVHDSGNPGCRAGILSADWSSNRHVHHVELDFVPGQLIPANGTGAGEVWGGLAVAYLNGEERSGPLVVAQGASTTIAALHRARRPI